MRGCTPESLLYRLECLTEVMRFDQSISFRLDLAEEGGGVFTFVDCEVELSDLTTIERRVCSTKASRQEFVGESYLLAYFLCWGCPSGA